MIQQLISDFSQWLAVELGAAGPDFARVYTLTAALTAIAASAIVFWITRRPVATLVGHFTRRTRTRWDDRFLSPRLLNPAATLMALLLLRSALPAATSMYPAAHAPLVKVLSVGVTLGVTWLAVRIVLTAYEGMRAERINVAGISVIRNVLNAIILSLSVLIIFSILLSRDLTYILSGMGAMAAVLSLVFKDSIVGMISGIRLVSNRMVKHGDWIIDPAHNINGRVTDVTLTAIKVRNWDNSVSTVPPSALVSGGFQNMERMLERGTRLVKRTLNIDLNSIRRLTEEEAAALGPEFALAGIEKPEAKVNLALWRRYIKSRIERHPLLEPRPRYMVRELPAGPEGVPIEIQFFAKCVVWEDFEELQADFTDEIAASARRFGLRLYQRPSGADFAPDYCRIAMPQASCQATATQPEAIPS